MVTNYLPVVAQTCSYRDCPEMEKPGIHKHQIVCNCMMLSKLDILRIRRLGVRVPSGVPLIFNELDTWSDSFQKYALPLLWQYWSLVIRDRGVIGIGDGRLLTCCGALCSPTESKSFMACWPCRSMTRPIPPGTARWPARPAISSTGAAWMRSIPSCTWRG